MTAQQPSGRGIVGGQRPPLQGPDQLDEPNRLMPADAMSGGFVDLAHCGNFAGTQLVHGLYNRQFSGGDSMAENRAVLKSVGSAVVDIGLDGHGHQRVSTDKVLESFHTGANSLYECGEVFAGHSVTRKSR